MAFRYSDLQTREVIPACGFDDCDNEAVREFHDEGLTGQHFCKSHFKFLQTSRRRFVVLDEFGTQKRRQSLAKWRCQVILKAYGR